MEAHILNSLGEDPRRRGEFDRAVEHNHAALEVASRIGDRFLMMGEQLNIGLVLARAGDRVEGKALLRPALSIRFTCAPRRQDAKSAKDPLGPGVLASWISS